jgi:hypothetical protein
VDVVGFLGLPIAAVSFSAILRGVASFRLSGRYLEGDEVPGARDLVEAEASDTSDQCIDQRVVVTEEADTRRARRTSSLSPLPGGDVRSGRQKVGGWEHAVFAFTRVARGR